MNKLIFLDCDGVINKSGSDPIDDGLMDNLSRIVEETGAKIVISSTWRLYQDFHNGIRLALQERGIDVVGATPEIHDAQRHEEISQWLEATNPSEFKYAVIDDNRGAAGDHPYFGTTMSYGLTPEIADKVIKHLNSED
jgi:hypothetical protein